MTGWAPNPNKVAAGIIRSAASIASGRGQLGLASQLWAFEERLREEGRRRLMDEHGRLSLTELRERAGRSVEEVAGAMGVDVVFVEELERTNNAALLLLDDYVDALGGSLEARVSFPDGTWYGLL